VNVHKNVVLSAESQGFEGSFNSSDVSRVVIEIVISRATIDGDRAVAWNETYASN
jgi:hypothetical protein